MNHLWEERKLYITLGVLMMLWGFSLSSVPKPSLMDYNDALICLSAGAFITWNGFQSLIKERATPSSPFRKILLSISIALVTMFLALRFLQ